MKENGDLPLMYWIPKIYYENPGGKRFIVASKLCSTKQQIQNSLQIQDSLIHLIKLIKEKNAEYFSTYVGSSFYTKLPYDKALDVPFLVGSNVIIKLSLKIVLKEGLLGV